jgi:hypothetical protein
VIENTACNKIDDILLFVTWWSIEGMLKLFMKKLVSLAYIIYLKVKSLYRIVTWLTGLVSQRNHAIDDDRRTCRFIRVYIIETFSMLIYPRQLVRCPELQIPMFGILGPRECVISCNPKSYS